MTAAPDPGSREARAIGCNCPTLDNADGRGRGTDENGTPLFVVNADCPVHGDDATRRVA